MPLLSICIPTYNRSSYLQKTLESIVSSEVFYNTDQIEIIISDNASPDDTQKIAESFVSLFPDKIKYFRNEKNINDANFPLAMSRGCGSFLKLHNDTLSLKKGALAAMLGFLAPLQQEKPLVFFINGNNKTTAESSKYNSADEFFKHISFHATWIGGFGLWKTDFDSLQNYRFKAETKLIQTDLLFHFAKQKKSFAVYNREIFTIQPILRVKGGYNTAEVFGKNYLGILKEYTSQGVITPKTYRIEKKKVLIKQIIPMYFDFDGLCSYTKGNYWKFTGEYHKNLYYYLSFFKILKKIIKNKLKRIKD